MPTGLTSLATAAAVAGGAVDFGAERTRREGEPRAGKRVVRRNHPRSRGEPDSSGGEG